MKQELIPHPIHRHPKHTSTMVSHPKPQTPSAGAGLPALKLPMVWRGFYELCLILPDGRWGLLGKETEV